MSRAEKRKYPRVEVAFPIRVAVEVGVGGSIPAQGETANISRGGILATVNRRVSLASLCKISFVGDVTGRIDPPEATGIVRRLVQRDHDFLIGVEFDLPLKRLEVTETLWRKKKLFRGRSQR